MMAYRLRLGSAPATKKSARKQKSPNTFLKFLPPDYFSNCLLAEAEVQSLQHFVVLCVPVQTEKLGVSIVLSNVLIGSVDDLMNIKIIYHQ